MLVGKRSQVSRNAGTASRIPRRRTAFTLGAVLALLGILAPLPWQIAGAEQPSTEGTIEFEDAPTELSPYEAGQEASISLFQSLLTETVSGSAAAHKVTSEAMRHLAGAYLYCASKQGSCPVILDGLLEVDIANARVAGEASCPVLEQFWRSYTAWDFSKRESYLRGVGQTEIATTFAKEKLPRYQMCKQAVAEALKQDKAARTAAAKKNLANAAFLLKQFKQKVPNIFAALGIAEQSQNSGEKKKATPNQ